MIAVQRTLAKFLSLLWTGVIAECRGFALGWHVLNSEVVEVVAVKKTTVRDRKFKPKFNPGNIQVSIMWLITLRDSQSISPR